MDRYGKSVRHVFKQLPLPMHPQARLGAEASLCAGAQGKFWEMHDWLFANKDKIARDTLITQATALGMDGDKFTVCVDTNAFGARVDEDMTEARSFGITGTPGFLINGIAIRGAMPFEEFVRSSTASSSARPAGAGGGPRHDWRLITTASALITIARQPRLLVSGRAGRVNAAGSGCLGSGWTAVTSCRDKSGRGP
jgi:hypothetical protein